MEYIYCVKGVINSIIIFFMLFLVLIIFLFGTPYQQGFNCDDESLRYPYVDDYTVHPLWIYAIGTGLPIFVMCLLELKRTLLEAVGKPVKLYGCNVPSWYWALYSSLGAFIFGCVCTRLSTDIIRYSVGRLKPHFVDICKPDWSRINCSMVYIFPIPCTFGDMYRLRDVRLSFPSELASYSAYTMIYLTIYLQVRCKFRGPELLLPFFQFFCLMMSVCATVSQIFDYEHHWSDCIFGFILGSVVAILIAVYVSDMFPRELPTKVKKNKAVFTCDCSQTGKEVNTTHMDEENC